jgi:ferredoxin/flavodoxin---NADP+ reductase
MKISSIIRVSTRYIKTSGKQVMTKRKHSDTLPAEKVRVTSNEEISPGVHLISYRRNSDFIPGQVVKIALEMGDTPRIYSICSSTSDDDTGILFNIKMGGFLTPSLAAVKPGDFIYASTPYGSFTFRGGPAWLIATGTGIAPFYSMLMSGIGTDSRLVHGVKYARQFYFADTFSEKLGSNYFRCCSRETDSKSFSGRVTDYLANEKQLPAGLKYYLCGKASMVVDVRDLLIERGVPFGNILAEIYF